MWNSENDRENEISDVSTLTSNTSVKDEDIVRAISNGGKGFKTTNNLKLYTRETVRFISAVDDRKFERICA